VRLGVVTKWSRSQRVGGEQHRCQAHRADHEWPHLDAIAQLGGFQEALDKARRRRDEQKSPGRQASS